MAAASRHLLAGIKLKNTWIELAELGHQGSNYTPHFTFFKKRPSP
jgi:hypothetical protein